MKWYDRHPKLVGPVVATLCGGMIGTVITVFVLIIVECW